MSIQTYWLVVPLVIIALSLIGGMGASDHPSFENEWWRLFMLKKTLSKLDGLWSKTQQDWVLIVHHILTEPTCPTVIIQPEDSGSLHFRVDRDTIEEGIEAAVDQVYRSVILGEETVSEFPLSDTPDVEREVKRKKWIAIAEQLTHLAYSKSSPLKSSDETGETRRMCRDAGEAIRELIAENDELRMGMNKKRVRQ